MSDTITPGNKRDKWTLRATELLNWLIDHKSAVLVAGDNITLTPQQDGTIEISAEGGGTGGVADVQVDGTSVVDANDIAQLATFTGATSSANGTKGLVKQPLIADKDKFLKGDGTWGEAGGGNVDDVVMNGQSIVDANKIANFNNYVELTRAEWEALPNSKYSDGILYCIKDSGSEKAEFFYPIIYSLAEREVGVWTDGKPLYQKSFIVSFVSATQGAQTFTIAHGIANLDIVTYIDCNINIDNGSFAPGIQNGQYYAYVKSINSTNIYVYSTIIGNSSYPNRFAYVTILYTKTTDTPGSGTWTPSGVPAHHYSTEEQVIGTWIDGSTLYEKTIVDNTTHTSGTITISHNISNLNEVTSINGVFSYGENNQYYPISFGDDPSLSNTNSVFKFCGIHKSLNRIRMFAGTNYEGNYAINKIRVTLQYTKTTD